MENLKFDELFQAYRLSYLNQKLTEVQRENLKHLQAKRGKTEITLSQIDFWMMKAGLIRRKVLSLTETGMIFSKFKSFGLTEQQFQNYLSALSEEKNFNLEDLKTKLMSAGLPAEILE